MSEEANPYRGPDPRTPHDSPEGTSGKAIASFVCGLLSFFCIFFTGIPAVILGILGLNDIGRSQGRVSGRGLAITGIITGCIGSSVFALGILIALLLPAVQAAHTAARRTVSMNNVQQIALALLNYESQHRHFPSVGAAEDGQLPHSWRVDILPYLERADLHERYHFDEPWDSANNKRVLSEMPQFFAAPGEGGEKRTTTNVVAIVGNDTIWAPGDKVSMDELAQQDGASNTILLVEVSDLGIPWTEPRDLTIDEFCKGINQPGGPQSIYPGGIVVCFADGHMKFLNADTDPATLCDGDA